MSMNAEFLSCTCATDGIGRRMAADVSVAAVLLDGTGLLG